MRHENKSRHISFTFGWLAVGALIFAAFLALPGLAMAEDHATKSALSEAQKGIIPIAAFTAMGDMARLDTALNEGLDAGLTVNETKEILVQMYAYAGFPRSLNALGALMAVLKERRGNGISDAAGREASPMPDGRNRLEFGTGVQTRLVGAPVKGPLFDFAPAIDQFLKEHLFADIFGRDVLDDQSREIATISALASLGGVDSQLRAHFRVGLNAGLGGSQLQELIDVLAAKVGKKEAGNAAAVLREVMESE